MWTDNETTTDLLGFKVHADLIRKVVTNPKLLPITFGVFGDWGGGKTSIMKMLQHDLDPKNYNPLLPEAKEYENVVCLYFNSWLFEGYDDAKAAILSSVLIQLAEHKRFGPRVREKVQSLLKSVNWMRVARMGIQNVVLPGTAAYLSGGLALLPALIQAAKQVVSGKDEEAHGDGKKDDAKEVKWSELVSEEHPSAGPQTVRSFRSSFASLLEDSDIKSLVILIDDLDRCPPERILENLEAIKLFLNVERTAFVIGADQRIVRHAVAHRYASKVGGDVQSEEQDRLITDYIEKLIQVPYRLPRLSPSETHTYMSLLFCQKHLAETDMNNCLVSSERLRTQNRYSTFGYANVQEFFKAQGQGMPRELSDDLAFCASAASMISEGLKGNPRQVKRFLNAFILRKELATVANLTHVKNDVLIKLMILEYTAQKQFLELYDWQAAQEGMPQQLVQLEALNEDGKSQDDNEAAVKQLGPGWGTKTIRRWLQMAPSLKTVDLRDYFWIARDRLELSLSGVAMLPPIVRKVFEDLSSKAPDKNKHAYETAKQLSEEDLESVLNLIEQQIERQPEQQRNYDILIAMAEARVNGSPERLAHILTTCPLDKVPPAVGSSIKTLVKARPELSGGFEKMIERAKESKTKFGKLFQETSKEKRG